MSDDVMCEVVSDRTPLPLHDAGRGVIPIEGSDMVLGTDNESSPEQGDADILPSTPATPDVVVWGKSDYLNPGSRKWLPLITHLTDTAGVAEVLWDKFFPAQVKRIICRAGGGIDTSTARRIYIFMAGIHDIGKASPDFVWKSGWLHERFNEMMPTYSFTKPPLSIRHETISHYEFNDWALDRLKLHLDDEDGESYSRISGWGVAVGGHHGKPPSGAKLLDSPDTRSDAYSGSGTLPKWSDLRRHFLDHMAAHTSLTARDITHMVSTPLRPEGQTLLSAMVVMSDWIASSEVLCPLGAEAPPHMPDARRVAEALEILELPSTWAPTRNMERSFRKHFAERFKPESFDGVFKPRPVQAKLGRHLKKYSPKDGGTFLIIEDATGSGKTEAGLAAAEMLAARSGARGVMVALPTMATSNAMFNRVTTWMSRLGQGGKFSTQLIHSQAALNDDKMAMRRVGMNVNVKRGALCCNDEDAHTAPAAEATIHSWMTGRHRAVLSDFAVGTIDQVLYAAFNREYTVLPHLGLASKVLIIDEIHDHDIYMRQFLLRVLRWLGAYRVPVIALSATLTPQVRAELHAAYMGVSATSSSVEPTQTKEYPLITSSERGGIVQVTDGITAVERRKTITLNMVPDSSEDNAVSDSEITDVVKGAAGEHGCVAVICNTVTRAQRLFSRVRDVMPEDWEVELMHSRFTIEDRRAKETSLVDRLGPKAGERRPEKYILIGTQVLEQSLDVDFDVMVTEVCPASALVQRAGRLHRHKRSRPEDHTDPKLFVVGFYLGDGDFKIPRGTEMVYGKCAPMVTAASLLTMTHIITPEDGPRLVIDPYGDEAFKTILDGWKDTYIKSRDKELDSHKVSASRADKWLVPQPETGLAVGPLYGWEIMSKDLGEFASVRDSVMDRTAYVMYRRADGELEVRSGNTRIVMSGSAGGVGRRRLLRLARQELKLPKTLNGIHLPTILELCKEGHQLRWDIDKWKWVVDPRSFVLVLNDDGEAELTVTSSRGNKESFKVRYSPSLGLRGLKVAD